MQDVQQAMARLEAARIGYRAAVLRSLDGAADGATIRAAIEEFRVVYAEVERFRSSGAKRGAATPPPSSSRAASRWRRLADRISHREVARKAT